MLLYDPAPYTNDVSSLCCRFIVPVSMIIINDVMAYMFGFFFGRTPLIKLSPKKTWEGYVGGGAATVLMGLLVRDCLRHIPTRQ